MALVSIRPRGAGIRGGRISDIGILIGVAIVAPLEIESGGELTGGLGLVMLPIVAAFVLLIGVIAAIGPARRGLGIQPIEALREQ